MRRCGVFAALFAASTTLLAGELTLKPETLKAWEDHEHAAIDAMQHRLHDGASFLRIDHDPDRLARVRAGEIVAWQGCEADPKQVPSGLIHDWMGAGFIPNARIVDVLAVVRDYRRYKEIYKPGIVDTQLLKRVDNEDHFSIVMRNLNFFTKTALEAEFESTYTQLDESRWYSMTRATRLQEIDNYGQPGERKLLPDRGHGYIWRMTSLSQMEERDGGVYVEEEVMALSRDVPGAVRWMAGPIIRRVAKESTAESIGRTRAAVQSMPDVISASQKVCGRGAAVSCWR